jgi:uncharacterized protein (DUF58 family)
MAMICSRAFSNRRPRRVPERTLAFGAVLPSSALVRIAAGAGIVLAGLAGSPLPTATITGVAAVLAILMLVLLGADAAFSMARWRRAPLVMERDLPQAFSVGVATTVRLGLVNAGARAWVGELFDCADPTLMMPAMPLAFAVGARQRQDFSVEVLPTERGLKRFEPAQIRLRSPLGLLDWNLCIGNAEARRVYPNFQSQARFAWLAVDRRLATLGLTSVRRRGSGTDFDQLVNYQAGDAVRHIDWKATLKHQRPVVRRFQDDRDQSVMLLLDCGRRMRADDTQRGVGTTHFDQALNALMLLAFIALSHGDAVGAMTFGSASGQEKRLAPRKGRQTLNALMAELADVQPAPVFSDYEALASDVLRSRRKRGLVVLVTNCRDEETRELNAALRLLRSRHLVVLASLREQVVGRIASGPLDTPEAALEVAAALDYEQRRRDMLARFAQGGVLTIDALPEGLGVELVERYVVLKGSGKL